MKRATRSGFLAYGTLGSTPRRILRTKCGENGFTLLEMLVVLAMLGLMLMISLGNIHGLGLNAKVKQAANLIIDTAKDTRSRSVSVQQFGTTGVFPSYGLHFEIANPGQITMFADCKADDNNDNTLNQNDTYSWSSSGTNCNGGNGLVQNITFDPNVEIKTIQIVEPSGAGWATTTQSKVDIEYLRPQPTIWITEASGNLLSVGKILITLATKSNEYPKTVIFYSDGHIFIQ